MTFIFKFITFIDIVWYFCTGKNDINFDQNVQDDAYNITHY